MTTDTTMTLRKPTLPYAAFLIAALAMFIVCLASASPAAAQSSNSGADQYLENVPNPAGEKPGDKDKKGGGGKSGGSSGSGGGSNSGSGSGSGGGYGEDETEDALSGPGSKAGADEKARRDREKQQQANATPGTQDGDRASADVPSAAVSPPNDGDGGGLSGGVIAFIVILLLGPVAFLLYRRLVAARRGIDTA